MTFARRLHRSISRRDFLNGVGVALTGTLLPTSAVEAFRLMQEKEYYPPTRMGMRGSHPGSFEIAHGLLDGRALAAASELSEEYDLIVVGGGISGLSAAHFYRKRFGSSTKILILDNHDDFGGHAKRNEFWHDGRMYLMNGGTHYVEAPSHYSSVAADLLVDLGIDRTRFYESMKKVGGRYGELGLSQGVFFDKETFGEDRLVGGYSKKGIEAFLEASPLSEAARQDVLKLHHGTVDYMPGLSSQEKKKKLAHLSYRDYLTDMVKVDATVVSWFNELPMGWFCVGIDALPALYGWEMGFPGFAGLGLDPTPVDQLVGEAGGQHGRENTARAEGGDPDLYFPDGNATIARLLVRKLIPAAVPGHSMEDVVTSRVDYARLDRAGSPVRIRLNSMAVKVEHRGDREVAVSYVEGGKVRRVHGGACVLACWNGMIPYLCDEVPAAQRKALLDGVKAPLVYTNVLISNWKAFVKAGVSDVTAPGSYHTSLGLGASLEFGDYRSSQNPDEPIMVRMERFPCSPGLTRREQHRVGRAELLATTFETFEHKIRDQMTRTFGPTGFDAERDILAIAVNRWPHGYSYTYNTLYDPESWAFTSTKDRPAIIGRQPIGSRITIANADAAASPHTDAAINEAYRAVTELKRGG